MEQSILVLETLVGVLHSLGEHDVYICLFPCGNLWLYNFLFGILTVFAGSTLKDALLGGL